MVVPSLEDEVEEILKKLVASHPEYNYYRSNRAVKGAGYQWKPDFILMKEGALDAIIECKDIGGKEWEKKTKFPAKTFEAHMCRAYVPLNDFHLKYPEARLYVIVRELPSSAQLLNKWNDIFGPIGAELMCLEMIRYDPELYFLSRF